MNSLEFINKEIEIIKASCNAFKIDYELFHRDSDKKNYEKLEEKLYHLQQIKNILEAWEVSITDPVILDTIKTLANGNSINWHRLPVEKRNTLKKVLEVGDGIS